MNKEEKGRKQEHQSHPFPNICFTEGPVRRNKIQIKKEKKKSNKKK